MDKKEFEKRLSKCSKESISNYLYHEFINSERILKEIELIEYDTKFKKLIKEMDRLNSLCRETKTDSLEGAKKYIEYHMKWEKTNEEIKKLHKWFDATI